MELMGLHDFTGKIGNINGGVWNRKFFTVVENNLTEWQLRKVLRK